MKHLSLAWVALLATTAALHAATSYTANFPNVNVRTNAQVGGTNFVKDSVVTNVFTLQSATASRVVATDGSKGLVSVSTTDIINGTGAAATFAQATNLLGMSADGLSIAQTPSVTGSGFPVLSNAPTIGGRLAAIGTGVFGTGGASNSVDSVVLISRAVNDTEAGNGHGFSDSSYITRGNTIAYNSFDARVQIAYTNSYDHYAGFQFAPTYSSSGTISIMDGLASAPVISAGTATSVMGAYILDPSGAGTVVNNYGVYIASLTKGSSANWAIYALGTAKSRLGGGLGIGADPTTQMLLVRRSTGGGTPNGTYSDVVVESTNHVGISLFSADDKFSAVQFGSPSKEQGALVYWSYANNLISIGTVRTNGGLVFMTGVASEKARIDSSGNLGIGVTAPGEKLEVAGNIKVSGTATSIQGGHTNIIAASGTPQTLFYVSVPNTNSLSGDIIWKLYSTDGTDTQSQVGHTLFDSVAKGTTVTAGLTSITNAAVVSGGTTLSGGLTADVATNNVLAIQATLTTSLTTTNMLIKWRIQTPSVYSVTAL